MQEEPTKGGPAEEKQQKEKAEKEVQQPKNVTKSDVATNFSRGREQNARAPAANDFLTLSYYGDLYSKKVR